MADWDEFDDLFVEAFRAAGAAPDPIGALRRLVVSVVAEADPHEREKSDQRMALTFAVPARWATGGVREILSRR